MPKFVEAVAKRTGRKQRIPAAWLDHPVIGEDFRQTPRDSARSATTSKQSAKKAAAKKSATPPAATVAGTTEAPPAGDKE